MDSLVNRALQSNFSLETAWHRLRSAQAVVDREGAGRFPTLGVSGRGEVQRPDSENNAQIRLGITSEYEIDLWGQIRSGVDAARYRMHGRLRRIIRLRHCRFLQRSCVLTLQLMEAQNQHELFEHQIETNQQVLSLIRARFGSGQIRSVDILRQRQLLESTREQKIATESRIEVLEHQLAILLGYAPQDGIAYTHRTLPDLPPLPDTGLPVELIQRRPDVKRAYNLLLAADRDVAVAISNRYPRLSLTALASGDDRGGLFKDWVGNLIGNLLLPVIDGGERGAEIKRNKANKKRATFGLWADGFDGICRSGKCIGSRTKTD